jgi:very-short-patch-repair endonuclease
MVRIKGQQPLTGDEKCSIVQQYVAGATLRGLAGEYRRSINTIRSVIASSGVPIKARGYGDPRVQEAALAARGHESLTDSDKQDIIRRYADGELLTELCKEYGRAKSTLKDILTESGITLRSRGYQKGTVWHDEWRKSHWESTHTDEFRQKSRENLLERLPSMRGPAVNTPIERRLHDALKKVGIGFSTQQPFLGRYLVDILIHQQPIIIEADGAQHYLPDAKERDAARDAALTQAGYRVFRFTGSEINKDSMACIHHVVDECNLVPDEEPVFDIRTSLPSPMKGRKHTPETRAKMSEAAKRRWQSRS